MPRKKLPVKFKYTIRRDEILYVKYPVKGLKNPVWRIYREETQEAVNSIIAQIIAEKEKELAIGVAPSASDKFFDFWLNLIEPRVSERTLQGYEKIVRLYLRPALGALHLGEVKPLNLQTLYQTMTAKGLDAQTGSEGARRRVVHF